MFITTVLLAALSVIGFFTSNQKSKSPQSSPTQSSDKIASLKPKPFKDVMEDNKNYVAIKYLAREGILEADEAGNFNPQNILTRAQWATTLVRLAGVDPDKEIYQDCFADVHGQPSEAAVCYADEAGWLKEDAAESFSIFDFVSAAWAQPTEENFNPDQPVKAAEAAGSLARLMEWEPGQKLTNAQALSMAQEKNLLPPNGPLTKGGAAELAYRSLATVPFGQEKYTPAADEALSRQKVGSLMESLKVKKAAQEKEEWLRVRDSAIRNFAEGSGIGYQAATEIVDSSQNRDEALKKVRQYRYDQWLDKRTSGGKTLEQADILAAAQQFIEARGGQQPLSLADVSLYKRADPEAEKQETSETSFNEGQRLKMIIPLDKDYQMLTLEQRKSGRGARYILDISAGDTFLWDNQNRGFVFVDLINVETGVIEQANSSADGNFKSMDKMLTEAVGKIESRLGQPIRPPGVKGESSSSLDKKSSETDRPSGLDCAKAEARASYNCLTGWTQCFYPCVDQTKDVSGCAKTCDQSKAACEEKAKADYRTCLSALPK